MQDALVLGGYKLSLDNTHTPEPGYFCCQVYVDYRCLYGKEFRPGEKKYSLVDFVVRTHSGRLVFLEVDEGQHDREEQLCETTRMWNVCESIAMSGVGANINVFWLRFNPDSSCKVGGVLTASAHARRFDEVVAFLDGLQMSPQDPPMQVGYAFYDCSSDGRPLVLNDPGYQPDVKEAVVCIQEGDKLVQPKPFPPVQVDPMFQPLDLEEVNAESGE